jgi:hypothetical protein
MVHNTPAYGHAPAYQISLTYLERQKCYGPQCIFSLKRHSLVEKLEIKITNL